MFENIELNVPLAVGHAPNMFPEQPGASITPGNFYQPTKLCRSSFLAANQTAKSLGAASYAPLALQRRGGRRVGQLAITGGSVIIGHLQEAPRVSDHQTPTCRSTKTGCILPRNWDDWCSPPPSQMTIAAFTTISPNFNWIADSFDESQAGHNCLIRRQLKGKV